MITLQCKIEFQSAQDREIVLSLMRRFSSAMRFAYQRLLEGEDRKDLKKYLSELFGINTRYADDAIFLAKSKILSCRERKQNPKKVIFGSRKLFEQLKKKHLVGKRRIKLKEKWKEARQGNLYSRGDKEKQGNLNLRFQWVNDELCLRINIGNRQYVYAKVIRSVKREKDKWLDFIVMLENAFLSKEWFPYSIQLKLKNGKVYAFISFEEKLPPITIKRENGVIGIDVNAYPYHLALAVVSKDGNLEGYQSISLSELLEVSSEKRQYLEWQVAHKIIKLARKENKAVVIEDLKRLPKGKRGDGFAKLRSRLQKWSYKRLLEKIEVLARREGIEVRKVNPAYTSVIGKLKYAPQFNIDKDVAGAYVIGRRGLGFKEKLPKNYEKLLGDKEFLSFSLARIEDKIAEIRKKIKEERNEYKGNRLRAELAKLKKDLKILQSYLQSLQSGRSEPATQHPVDLWKEQVRGRDMSLQKSWRVLSVALAFSYLEKSYRDFSPLKRLIISGDWVGVASRLAPVPGVGAMALPNTACWGWECLNRRNINTPAQTIQTGLYSFV
jgi:IS605 OrfB family transposase